MWPRFLASVIVAGFATALSGCSTALLTIPEPALSAALNYILNNADDFVATTDEGEEEESTSGTPVSIADDLDGCWGLVKRDMTVDLSELADGGEYTADLLYLLHFDAATGTLRQETYFRDTYRRTYVLLISSGTFEVGADGVVTWNFDEFAGNDALTGEIVTIANAEPRNSEIYMQRHGDELLLWLADATGATPDVYYRFDCPD